MFYFMAKNKDIQNLFLIVCRLQDSKYGNSFKYCNFFCKKFYNYFDNNLQIIDI